MSAVFAHSRECSKLKNTYDAKITIHFNDISRRTANEAQVAEATVKANSSALPDRLPYTVSIQTMTERPSYEGMPLNPFTVQFLRHRHLTKVLFISEQFAQNLHTIVIIDGSYHYHRLVEIQTLVLHDHTLPCPTTLHLGLDVWHPTFEFGFFDKSTHTVPETVLEPFACTNSTPLHCAGPSTEFPSSGVFTIRFILIIIQSVRVFVRVVVYGRPV